MAQRIRHGVPVMFSNRSAIVDEGDEPLSEFIDQELSGDMSLQRKQRRGVGKPGWARHVEADDRTHHQRHERRPTLK